MPEMKPYGISAIRELARERVEQSSLRAVAEEIDMSFSGLRSFLKGTDPHPDTIKKLAKWYAAAKSSGPPAPRPRKPSHRSERVEEDAAIETLALRLLSEEDVTARIERFETITERLAQAAEIAVRRQD